MKYVLFYETTPQALARAPEIFPAHQARWKQYVADGSLLMIGTFANPLDGAMSIFTTREAAETFATGDPFVREGVVTAWHINEWNEAILREH